MNATRIHKQAALLDAANDAIYVRVLDHTVTYWNHGAERLFGWTRAEVLGRKITDFGNVDSAAFEAAHAALLEQGNWSGELKQTGKAGKEITVFCRWTLWQHEQGRPAEILAINTDITEKKQLQAQFLRAQRMEGIESLAGGIAHGLNNILAPILMSTQLLRETERIIRETFPRNIQVRVNTPKDLWLVLGDATQVHQALMNLCVNARDALPDGGALILALQRSS